jgi:cytoskeletal protein CcmA (bactofilin family)
MATSTQAFVVPPGLQLAEADGGLALVHAGDVILHGTLGLDLVRVHSAEGDVVLHTALEGAQLEAPHGRVLLHGDARTGRIQAAELNADGSLQAASAETVGDLVVGGDASIDELRCGGDLRVGGALRAGAVQAQSIEVQGDARFDDAALQGTATFVGSATGARLQAGGVQVDGAARIDAIHSAGDVVIEGDVQATSIRAARVRLLGGTVEVRTIQATESIEIGPGAIRSDALIAPSVILSRDTRGKITVVESRNEVGASAVKGCLRLADVEDLFGNSAQFMADRGLAPLGEVSAAAPAAPSAPAPAAAVAIPTAAPADDAPEVSAPETAADPVDVGWDDEPAAPAAAVAVDDSQWTLEEVVDAAPVDTWGQAGATAPVVEEDPDALEEISQSSLDVVDLEAEAGGPEEIADPDTAEPAAATAGAVEDIFDLSDQGPTAREVEAESLAPQPAPEPADPVYVQMSETVGRIVACYDHDTMPPAVVQLQDMVEARNYTGIRDDITNIWNQLLKFHQKRGLRIQPQVTTTFNSINSIVRKL